MKIYAVVDNVDLGYHVIKAFYHRKDAEEELQHLLTESYHKKIDEHSTYPDIMDGKIKTYDEAKEYVDTWFNWEELSIEEIEVE